MLKNASKQKKKRNQTTLRDQLFDLNQKNNN